MTTANKVTIVRILLVPFFVAQVLYYVRTGNETLRWLAIGCFALAAISDGIDGFIARHFNQRSELGAVLDPLADKLLLVSGIVLLSLRNEPHLAPIPIWLTVTILSRDVLLLIGLALIHYVVGKVVVRPHLLGKCATVLQMAAVLWALFKLDQQWLYGLCIAAAALTGVSGLIYLFDGMQQLSKHPAALAANQSSTTAPRDQSDESK
ncbi:MAG TPA: CDP-alcohol phosphatidyltransferase family protein [Candidatus Acidoferrum sp.]|nr:CDP-alcohol phosphatidyltransferase family protein [Candidatus Acidoferrum sp.]